MGANRDLSSAFGQTQRSTPYSVLDGLYVLHDELGSGGFGKVYFLSNCSETTRNVCNVFISGQISNTPPNSTKSRYKNN